MLQLKIYSVKQDLSVNESLGETALYSSIALVSMVIGIHLWALLNIWLTLHLLTICCVSVAPIMVASIRTYWISMCKKQD